MPRPADPAKREDLLCRVRSYVLRNGLASLSLRPLARELGTSDRMLLYYFGTKERMVAEALSLDDRRPLLRFRDVRNSADAPEDAAGLRRLLEELWEEFHSPDRQAVMPLQFELMTASVLHPDRYGPLMRDLIAEWTDLFTPLFVRLGMSDERARNEATLVVDAILGLLYGSLADGDWDRAAAAFHTLLDRLESGWTPDGAQTDASPRTSRSARP
ncbi:TetR/AcrR family transcriptional regulator [Streptomyces sp. NPDC002917]|uniref:TetR/AcrR family transcriptional regulator n=1 Tax=unclassified Streptomyces TaxID=2593676 RepID=UPI002E80EF3D|nr:TetR/AcrR family transcriptional regulator [Streptomyces sp. NBC_00562]WTC77243.1 TetR/AcrR family transcriptional regulator [Streptomyces sp. NBC_01653]WTD38242.1 TetR/AcrR family transcriptional regulator [Streptomyces sp. NBC_01643]WTD93618.1 TetR/AcrR family transcriptional regulator [Streptomyces sp. NBC_01637]WTF25590.1 TetR/AcrR family transcriptional regulator [Streptomyces sp. NBC_01602]WUC24576.1 TetR/AcrR family transcriptional regulator [Streptomyces sp. NBC_00562]